MDIQIFILIGFFGLTMGDFKLLTLHAQGFNSSWTGTDANSGSIFNPNEAEYGGALNYKKVVDYETQKHIDAGGYVMHVNSGGTLACNAGFNTIADKKPELAGELSGKFVKAMGLDAMSLGNHVFDYGIEAYAAYMREAGMNTDKSKVYLVYEANCYTDEAAFKKARASGTLPQKINFKDKNAYSETSNVTIFVGANFYEDEYFKFANQIRASENKAELQPDKIRRSLVRIFETKEGTVVPVGIIGYLTTETKHKTEKRLNEVHKMPKLPAGVSRDDTLKIGDELEHVKYEAERLKSMGVDIIFALGFAGPKKDEKIAVDRNITGVFGGLTPKFKYNGTPSIQHIEEILSYPIIFPKYTTGEDFEFTPIADTVPNMKYAGSIILNFDNNGKLILNDKCNQNLALETFTKNQNPILISRKFVTEIETSSKKASSDQEKVYGEINALLVTWTNTVTSELKSSGKTITEYLKVIKFIKGGESCKHNDCEMGSVIADSHMHWYEKVKSTLPLIIQNECPYAFGVINAGAVRANIGDQFTCADKPKSVTLYEIVQILTGNSPIVVVQMTNAQIIKMFQCSISQWNESEASGRLLHVSSNVKVTYDFKDVTTEVKVEGKDVFIPKDITVEMLHEGNWTNITNLPYTSYRVVTTGHLHEGRTGYEVIKQSTRVKSNDTEPKDVQESGQKVLTDYLLESGKFNPLAYTERSYFTNRPVKV